jgi:type I restriction enzyme, S subunit
MSRPKAESSATPLSALTDLIQYGYTAKSSSSAKGPKYLRITDIQDEHVEWTTVPRVSIGSKDLVRYRLRAGDIVFARSGATVGKSFLIENDPGDAVFASYLIRVRCTSGRLDPRYAALYFKSEDYWQQIRDGATGTGQPNFNGSKLSELRIPQRSLNEQQEMVARLDALLTRSKNARTELACIPRLVERYKQVILAAAFRGDLTAAWRHSHPKSLFSLDGIEPPSQRDRRRSDTTQGFSPPHELPKTWRWTPLPQLGTLDRGRSRHRPRNAPKLYGGPYPFVQTGDIKAAQGRVTTYSQTYSKMGLAQSRLWPKGTLCITIAANIAETAILGIDACFPDSIVGFIANERLCDARYIEFFLRTAKTDLEAFAPATAQKNINLETLRIVHVPCPPLCEQQQIVEQIEKSFASIDKVSADGSRAASLLERLDRATLAKAFRVELVAEGAQSSLPAANDSNNSGRKIDVAG